MLALLPDVGSGRVMADSEELAERVEAGVIKTIICFLHCPAFEPYSS